jgi:hypothetical protein
MLMVCGKLRIISFRYNLYSFKVRWLTWNRYNCAPQSNAGNCNLSDGNVGTVLGAVPESCVSIPYPLCYIFRMERYFRQFRESRPVASLRC